MGARGAKCAGGGAMPRAVRTAAPVSVLLESGF
jgi:hypothetical protein